MSERVRIVKVEPHPKNALMRQVAALVLENLFADGLRDGVASPSQIDAHIRFMDPYDSYRAMLDESGQLVAAALFSHLTDKRITKVYQLVVNANHRGQGLGTEMMQHVAESASEAGNERVGLLGLEPDFYAKLGFACTGEYIDGSPMMEAAVEDILAYSPANRRR